MGADPEPDDDFTVLYPDGPVFFVDADRIMIRGRGEGFEAK